MNIFRFSIESFSYSLVDFSFHLSPQFIETIQYELPGLFNNLFFVILQSIVHNENHNSKDIICRL